jgi:hypothetical protein
LQYVNFHSLIASANIHLFFVFARKKEKKL